MDILILKNNITDNNTLNKGIELVKQIGLTIGLEFNIKVKETSKSFSSISLGNNQHVVNHVEIFQEGVKQGYIFSEDSLVCLVYDWTKIKPQPTNPAMNGLSMQIPQQWYTTYPEVFMQYFFHELSHYFLNKNNQIDITHNYDSNFNNKPRYEWYLHLIKPYIKKTTMNKWKYFKLNEKTGSEGTIADLNPKLVDLLDKAREIAKIPFIITSGYRSKETNERVGGIEGSAHTKGLAVDIKAKNSNEHFIITKALMEVGFTRISRCYSGHIHTDIDTTKAQNVLF